MAKSILIVDDDLVNTELTKRTLQSKGYDVQTAPDGEVALETLKKSVPDVILLDVQMPKMDGYTFILKKNCDPTIAKIPVIILTALGKTEPLFKRHGVKAYLLKPINTPELLEKVKSIIEP